MSRWCESCARKNVCYSPDIRPRCYMPTTNTAIICPNCGSSEYVKSFIKDWGILYSGFKYKCTRLGNLLLEESIQQFGGGQ